MVDLLEMADVLQGDRNSTGNLWWEILIGREQEKGSMGGGGCSLGLRSVGVECDTVIACLNPHTLSSENSLSIGAGAVG